VHHECASGSHDLLDVYVLALRNVLILRTNYMVRYIALYRRSLMHRYEVLDVAAKSSKIESCLDIWLSASQSGLNM
jgi:hypothetical protein